MLLLGVVATTSGAAEGDTTLVSVDSAGNQANGSTNSPPDISSDGRFVAFYSEASNLVADDTNDADDVFVRDRRTGTTERVSVDSSGDQGNATSYRTPSISADGRFVAFGSWATNLVPNDTNGEPDAFVHDRQTGATRRVSVSSSGNQANSWIDEVVSISANGRFVGFTSWASNLVPNDTCCYDIFVRDRKTDTTRRVSVNSSGKPANGGSRSPSFSSDGRFVAFSSEATNLARNDSIDTTDVFVRDRKTGTTELVSADTSGYPMSGTFDSGSPSISAGGRFVAFASDASDLVANDTNDAWDVFVRDRKTDTTRRVSVNSLGNQVYTQSYYPSISADGRFVVFSSGATNLVANDTNGEWDIFVHERDTTAPKVRRALPAEGATGVARKANVVATFSERMEKTTLTKANFKLYKLVKNPNGTTTAKQVENVAVTPGLKGLQARLNPFGGSDGQLAKNTRYKAVVSTGALDVFGNRLDQKPTVSGYQPKVWHFKTRG